MLRRFYPRWSAWLILAAGMGGLMLWAAHDKGLSGGQLAAMLAACVLVAGVCAWLIGGQEID
jgi:hypothetical protein